MERYNLFELYDNNKILKRRYFEESALKVYYYGILRLLICNKEWNVARDFSKVSVSFTDNQRKAVKSFCKYPNVDMSLKNSTLSLKFLGLVFALLLFPLCLIRLNFHFRTKKLRRLFVDLQLKFFQNRSFGIQRVIISSNLTPLERSFIKGIKLGKPSILIWLIPHGAWMKSYPSTYWEDIIIVNSNVARNFYKNQIKKKLILNKTTVDFCSKQSTNLSLGMSINGNSCPRKVLEILSSFKHPVLVKFHPSCKRSSYNLAGHKVFNGSLKEYFLAINCHLSGNSTMHLDSIFNGVQTWFVEIDNLGDEYMFLESGLLDYYSSSKIVEGSERINWQKTFYEQYF